MYVRNNNNIYAITYKIKFNLEKNITKTLQETKI